MSSQLFSFECQLVKQPLETDFTNWSPKRITETLERIKYDIVTTMKILSIPKKPHERTFNNTVQPLIDMDIRNAPENIFYIIYNFFPDKQLREAAKVASGELSSFYLSQIYQPVLYNAINDYFNHGQDLDELNHEQKRYLDHTLRDLKRHGLHLDEKIRHRIEKIKKQLIDYRSTFSYNLNQVDNKFLYTKDQLSGLPNSWFVPEKHDKKQNKWIVTLQYPDYMPLMEYAHDQSVRQEMYNHFMNRCREKNEPLLNKILKLRSELAKLLGYKTYADYVTEVKIIKNGDNAIKFLTQLNKEFDPVYKKEKKQLLEFAKKHNLNKSKLDPWDLSYYQRLYKETINDLDMNEVRKYFPLETVKQGMFKIYQHLFQLQFTEINTDNKWHPDVELYSVVDSKSKQLYGYFYLDLYPRDGKYGHAAVFTIYPGCNINHIDEKYMRRSTVSAMACNFAKHEDLLFSNVVTLFHEFGHLIHHICSVTDNPQFNGHSVERDFVEAPSQMLEYWCFDYQALQIMSYHKQLKQSIPEQLVIKLQKVENTLQGYFTKRQLSFGLFDLRVHTQDFTDIDVDCNQNWIDIYKYVFHEETDKSTCFPATFGHIAGGYEAGYYGYLLAESYAANMYYKRFKIEGLLNSKIGIEYRNIVLKQGATKDGLELLAEFLHSEPESKYLLIAKGLIKD
jgi:thimet oligopeptidase